MEINQAKSVKFDNERT